ncbi:hypothetical protein KY284_030194 [Solanum tuberosum]|nr:hypothetical protein KY284_030194 [Solanum tuberosum]
MATGSETLPLKGKVTWESILEAFADVSWKMRNIKESMASMEGRLGMEERSGGTRVPNQEPTTKGVTDAFVGCSRIQGKEDPSCGRQGTMATGSETLPLKGKVTWESILEAFADVSWKMRNIKESMASVEGRPGVHERSGGTRVPNQEPTTEGVTDAFVGCSRIQGKEDPSCGRQGTIATLDTFTIANEQSVNVRLSICEPIASLPCVDNVLVKSVDILVDPIDDRIDSFSKIDLCPPIVDTYALNASSFFCNDCVDQPVYECSSLVEGSCNVIKKPQLGGTNGNVDHLNRSDSLSVSFVEDPIVCFAHRDHGELECFNSSLVVVLSLFKYNVLFEDDEITPIEVPSGVNLESSVVLNNYNVYSNPLWCEAFLPKDGNLFLEDESTLVGKECDEEEGGVCFPITSSSWCVSLLDSMTNAFEPIGSHTHENTLEEWSMLLEGNIDNLINGCALDPRTWLAYPFDPSSKLNCSICVGMLGRNGRQMVVDIVNSFPYARKLFLRFYHPLEEPTLCVGKDSFLNPFSISYPEHDDVECESHGGRRYLAREGEVCTFFYYLFAYDEIPSWIRSALTFYPFDLGGCLKAFELVGVSSFRWYSLVVEKNDHCPCSPCVGLIAMTIEDVWLFLVFESPRLIILSVNPCTTPHAKRISFLLMIYMVLRGLDLRTQSYLLAYGDTHTCVGSISYVNSGINRANESLLDSLLCNPFPFAPGVNSRCAECSNNTFCYCKDSSLVLLLDPMFLNEVYLPIWVGNTYVREPAHELGILTLLKLSSALDGALTWVNTTYAFTLRMEDVKHVWMTRREFHTLHGNICTIKELPVGQHHAWMIAWSVGGLTKQGGATRDIVPFGELTYTSATRQTSLARVPRLQKCPKELRREKMFIWRSEDHWQIAKWIGRWSPNRPKFQ